mgnify:CR=1 FL=1
MKRILVVEDDPALREELALLLQANGYWAVEKPPCDLALLDINLPGESGFELCRKLRATSSVPVIFLTGRQSVEDEILGFGMGADDYIRKPFHSSVLLCRMAKLLKRRENTVLTARGLALDLSTMTVRYGEHEQELTKNETRILACLMHSSLCTREQIIEDLWQNGLYIDENTLYVNISRLRDKLRRLGAVDFVRTMRGVGYQL